MTEEKFIPVQFLYFVDSGSLEHVCNYEKPAGFTISEGVDVWQVGAVLNIKMREQK